MSFFKRLFGGGEVVSDEEKQKVANTLSSQNLGLASFGRYTDCNKTTKQLENWKIAQKAFSEKKYVDSFVHFLNYVKDESLDNLTVKKEGETIHFEFIQGSRRIVGHANEKDFVAETKIAEMGSLSIPVMRKLMGLNYGLKYSKFALNETVLCMKFSSLAIDASPHKLYAGLRELAKKSDQQDDLLLSEFSVLKQIDADHIIPVNSEKQLVKYDYLIASITETKEEIAKLDQKKMSGGISFLLLYLTYKIDYLIAPQGKLTDSLEQIQTLFFKKTNEQTHEKNTRILKAFDALLTLSKEEILEGLYDVKCTFGIANAAAHKTVMDMMFKEREKVGWYQKNGYPKMAEAVYGYMLNYAFFNYGMVYPVSEMLNLGIAVLNPNFYEKMGNKIVIVNPDGGLNKKNIVSLVNAITKKANKSYPHYKFNHMMLRFDRPTIFIDSLIVELDKVNLTK